MLTLAGVGSASAATPCDEPIAELRTSLQQANRDSADARGRARLLLSTFVQKHPECESQLRALGVTAGAQRPTPGQNAKGFLGPIGWLWNTVYYRVYQGNAVMMATVGWALFLAPVILVFSGVSVIRGATSAFHKQTKTPPAALSVHE